MRHPATAIALVLALLSGFVLAQLWSLGPVSSRSIQAVPSAQVEATTLEFYRAVNTFLDGGDGASLRQILHPGFVSHQPGAPATGNVEDFLQQLDSIRRFYPGIQLTADVTPLSGSAASATLSWNTVERHDFAGTGIDPGDLIGRLDLVRIERGLIVERWSSAQLAGRLDAYPSLSIDLPVALDTLVARVRQMSLQGDYEPITNRVGHLLLIDLSGKAFLEVIRPVSMPAMTWQGDSGWLADPAPVESAQTVALDRVEAVFLPAGTQFRMWDGGGQDAELIALEFGPPVIGDIAPAGPLLADLRSTLWSGIELKGVGNRLTLSFGQAQLLPEAMLSSPKVEGMELAWVTSGTLDMAGTRGEARVRTASGLRSQLIEGHAVLRPGDAGAAGPGSDVTYRVPGNASATVWFFSLIATPDQANANEAGTPTGPTATPTPPPERNVS